MPKKYDLSGREFNFLKVIDKAENSRGNQIYWNCQCQCGKEIEVSTRNLLSEKVKSCGCMKRKAISDKMKTHGMTETRIFRIWCGMKCRCYIPTSSGYENYGGRGIIICPEWLGENGFSHFYEWSMNNGYADNLSLDRINNDKGYSPDNCRWVTKKGQANNRRSNRTLTAMEETHTISEWQDITGIGRRVIEERIDDLHWDIEKALTTKVRKKAEQKLDRQIGRIEGE